MLKYIKYLRSILKHKWFVFIESCKLGIPFLGVVHDISKFTPGEFIAYAKYFYGDYKPFAVEFKDGFPYRSVNYWRSREYIEYEFKHAWNKHQKRNKHHWQYWLITNDSDEPQTLALAMPHKYVLEMIADWRGAGRAYGNSNTIEWYLEHRDKIILHEFTRGIVEDILLMPEHREEQS